MKKNLKIFATYFSLFCVTVLIIFSCKKVAPEPPITYQPGSYGYGSTTGSSTTGGSTTGGSTTGSSTTGGVTYVYVTFYNNNSSIGAITVNLNGSSSSITYNTTASSCNTPGCANFTLPSGTYYWTASATTGESWSGTNSFTNACNIMHLQ